VLLKRYYQENEDVDGMFRRVAKAVAAAETTDQDTWENRYFNLMRNLRMIPNSPTLMNAGTQQQQLSACFVLGGLELDSMEGIMAAARAQAMVLKWGGGTGFDLSTLRPKGDMVNSTHKVACGPVAVLKLLQQVSKMVTQGGRRAGANMAILSVEHPDILEFVNCKNEDPQTFSDFNISVMVTDEFMRAVKGNKEWTFRSPKDGTAFGTVQAQDIWQQLITAAHKTGDPGLFFFDQTNRSDQNPVRRNIGTISATNPCLRGDTKLWTINGPQEIQTLVGSSVPVLTQLDDGALAFRMMRNIRKTRESTPIVKVTLKTQRRERTTITEIFVTPDHKMYLTDGTKTPAGDLKTGHHLASVYRHLANSKGYLKLQNGYEDVVEHRVVASWKHGSRPEYPTEHVDHIDENKQNNHPDNLRVLPAKVHNALNMLGGRNPVVRFPEKNVFNKGFSGEANGMYGKTHTEETKRKISKSQRSKVNHTVVSIEKVDAADVYNGTVDETHKFFIESGAGEGVLVANCGEVPLHRFDACNLASLDLAKYVKKSYDGHFSESIDKERLREDIALSIRFLDNIVTVNDFPLPEIREQVDKTRRIGLGAMGLHTALIAMGVPYDSDEALYIAEQAAGLMQSTADLTSMQLADERGCYGAWEGSVHERAGVRMRNAWRLSIAPTGTISIIAGTSTGIEPLFSLAHMRTTYDGMQLPEINYQLQTRLKQEGWSDEELTRLTERLMSGQSLQEEPDVSAGTKTLFKVAGEISPEAHVKMQSVWQRFVTAGVSKTVNMPNSATVEDVGATYMNAWERGCKGITIFRDGCREGGEQVLSHVKAETPPPVEVAPVDARYRERLPATRDSRTHHFSVGNVDGYFTIGFYPDGRPGELFITCTAVGSTMDGLLDALATNVSIGLQHGVPMESIVRKFQGASFEPYGFTGDPEIPQARSIIDYIGRWIMMHVVNRNVEPTVQLEVPKVYTNGHTNGHKIVSGDVCPDCGRLMVYQSGCLTCQDQSCGYSKCG